MDFKTEIRIGPQGKRFPHEEQRRQECINYLNKMLKKRGFVWCARAIARKGSAAFVFNKEKRSIELSKEAMGGNINIRYHKL